MMLFGFLIQAQTKTIHFDKMFMGSKGMATATLKKLATPYNSTVKIYTDKKIKVDLPKINQTYIFKIDEVTKKQQSKEYVMNWKGTKYKGFLELKNDAPVYFYYSNDTSKVLLTN